MTDVAGLGFDVGLLIHLVVYVRKFYLPGLVIYADVFELFLPGNVFDDQGNIIPQIVHHGIMRPKLDGVR